MKLLLLNDSYFGQTLERPDMDILRVGPGPDNDIVINPLRQSVAAVIADAGFEPDAILQIDSIDGRVIFKGLDEINVPKAFYAIDGPINEFWQFDWAHAFDHVFVDQRETEERMQAAGIEWAEWLPLAADPHVYHEPEQGSERDIDIAFVGTIDPELRPKRSAILYRLKQIADVTIVDGDGRRSVPANEVADIYRRSKLVLNESLFDGVNLRTFEAMACGAVVLTEADRGAEDLFADLPVLSTFDSKTLEKTVAQLLANPVERREMGRYAAEVIRDSHTIALRAEHVLTRLERTGVRIDRAQPASRAKAAWGVLQASMKWEQLKAWGVEALRDLATYLDHLPTMRWVQILEITGRKEKALEMLLEAEQRHSLDEYETMGLASLAMDQERLDVAGHLLGVSNASAADLHVAIGNRLEGLGVDLDPGLNRSAGPASAWTAFEHFKRAYTLDPDNLGGLEGMDRILHNHHGGEFTLRLWQQWHARHPRDPEAIRKVLHRAKGVLHSSPFGTRGTRKESPFRTELPENQRPDAIQWPP